MFTSLGKSSFGLLCVSFVNANQFLCVFLSLSVLRVLVPDLCLSFYFMTDPFLVKICCFAILL